MNHNKHYLLACYILHYLFVRPKEMSYIKVGDFNITKKTLYLHGSIAKNHNDALLTLPDHVIKLMIDLRIFDSPGQFFLFSNDFRPGKERRTEKAFRDYWESLYPVRNLNLADQIQVLQSQRHRYHEYAACEHRYTYRERPGTTFIDIDYRHIHSQGYSAG